MAHPRSSRLRDTSAGYGWISIALHWLAGTAIVALLFLGSSIESTEPEQRASAVLLHTSIAISCYIVLWARIVWRLREGHPGPLPNQKRAFFLVGKWVHYATVFALAAMLISGPLMVWSGGESIGVFDWFSIPSPWEANHELRDTLHSLHAAAATVIFIGVLLHLGGVYKHAAFDQDGTFGKMLVAARVDAPPDAPEVTPVAGDQPAVEREPRPAAES